MSAWSDLIDKPDYRRDHGYEGIIGSADALESTGGEPTGLLTHHLVHGPEGRAFKRQFVNQISTHHSASWISARDAFGVAA